MRNRALRLRKETLTELTGEHLDLVVAASGISCGPICLPASDLVQCLPTDGCFTGTLHPTDLC